MMETYSDLTIAGWMSWFHFAILFVPVVIATTYFEWKEWRLEHPKATPSQTVPQRRWKPNYPFAMPM